MTLGIVLLDALALYIAVGSCIGIAFVTVGVDRMLPVPMSFTLGARMLLLPGSAALWPYLLVRWFKAGDRR